MAAVQFIFSLLLISLATQFPPSTSESEAAKQSLVNFMANLSGGNFPTHKYGWNTTSDPCRWLGVHCDASQSVMSISLSGFQFAGTLDAAGTLCSVVESLAVLILRNNTISGEIPESLGNCTGLTILALDDNRFTGSIPGSILRLRDLTALEISHNEISGEIPEGLAGIPRLVFFLAENNRLSGAIPQFDFRAMARFNVSNNELVGPIPEGTGRFGAESFGGNPGLCGKPLENSCPGWAPPPASEVPSPARSPEQKGTGFCSGAGEGWVGLISALGFSFLLIRFF
ncbi:unnamed protein product [Linum trigynum]|uniref:Leucine-rich repeat-containing N-terminal plant-type domain-containing protein n=1 Tax=Linum trigynum TaxID=586398 RepID=A0AAV2CSI3_9ROSI